MGEEAKYLVPLTQGERALLLEAHRRCFDADTSAYRKLVDAKPFEEGLAMSLREYVDCFDPNLLDAYDRYRTKVG